MDKYALLIIIFALFIGGALLLNNKPYDDTDPAGGRSGMTLLTDHGTGCQYLYRSGAITPRMGRDGRQVCSGSVR